MRSVTAMVSALNVLEMLRLFESMGLEVKQFICTKRTTATTKSGLKHSGSLLCTIQPIRLVLNRVYEQRLARLVATANRQRAARALALRGDSTYSV